MFKIITMAKRKSDMTFEEYSKYWYDVHGSLILKTVPATVTSRIKQYAQNHAIDLPGRVQPYDGVAEFCFDDFDSLRAWSKFYFSDEAKILRDDQAMFTDLSTAITVITEQKVII